MRSAGSFMTFHEPSRGDLEFFGTIRHHSAPTWKLRLLRDRTGPVPLLPSTCFDSVALFQTGLAMSTLFSCKRFPPREGPVPTLHFCRLTCNNCCSACGAARQWQKGLLLLEPSGPPWNGFGKIQSDVSLLCCCRLASLSRRMQTGAVAYNSVMEEHVWAVLL